MPISPTTTIVTTDAYQSIRDDTERLAAPLSAEDQQIQSMPDVSPTKWHRAHITWFFETFLLRPHLPAYRSPDPRFEYLYNSYYEAVGDRHPRPERGLVSRPGADEVAAYRRHVDDEMHRLLQDVIPDRPELVDLVLLGLGSIAWNAVGMLAVMDLSPKGTVGRGTGVVLLGFLFGSAAGTPLLGLSVDVLGTYGPGWIGVAVLYAATILISFKIPRGTTIPAS